MSAHEDAHVLHKAMKGLGTDDKRLVDVITHRTQEQILSINAAYVEKYNKTLDTDIKDDTSGNYRKLLRALILPRHIFFAKSLRKAIKGLGTDNGAVIDVFAYATNFEIQATVQAYENLFHRNLLQDVKEDTSGYFESALKRLMQGQRDERPFDPSMAAEAAQHAHKLFKKGEGRMGTNDEYFVEFFTRYSNSYIQAVAYYYQETNKHTLPHAIEKETSGEYRRLLLALAEPRGVYFAKRVHHAVEGVGTKDHLLQRIFVMNSREQLAEVKAAYELLFKRPMEHDIKDDTSGWYKKTLVSLLN